MNVCMQKLILKFEFITAIDFILHKLFALSFVYGRFVILICAVCVSPPPPQLTQLTQKVRKWTPVSV